MWDGNSNDEAEVFRFDESSDGTFVTINGSSLEVEPESNFKDTIVKMAAESGLGKFRVFLNEAEINPSDAPELIGEGDKIRLTPYDIAA